MPVDVLATKGGLRHPVVRGRQIFGPLNNSLTYVDAKRLDELRAGDVNAAMSGRRYLMLTHDGPFFKGGQYGFSKIVPYSRATAAEWIKLAKTDCSEWRKGAHFKSAR